MNFFRSNGLDLDADQALHVREMCICNTLFYQIQIKLLWNLNFPFTKQTACQKCIEVSAWVRVITTDSNLDKIMKFWLKLM